MPECPCLPAGTAHACRTASYCLRFSVHSSNGKSTQGSASAQCGLRVMKGIDPSAPKLGPFYLEAVIFKKLQQKLGTKISLAFSPKHKFFTTICLCHQKVFTETETQKFPCLLEENLQNPCLQPQRHNTTLEAPLEILQNWKTICWHPKSSAQPFHILPQRIPTKTCMMRRRPGVKKNLTCWSRKTNIAWRLQCLTKYLHVVTFTS